MRLLVTFLLPMMKVAIGSVPLDIYWNSSNIMFSETRVPVVEVNRDTDPWEYDQVNIICPSGENITEKHIIYSVDKNEFDSCRITSLKPRIIAVCDQPQNFMYFTITFRSFTPSPQQMEFMPGESYYFISTSSSLNIYHRAGGWCSSSNMRMIFRVAENTVANYPRDLQTSKPDMFWSKYWSSRVPDVREVYNTRTRNYESDFSDKHFVRQSDDEYLRDKHNNEYQNYLEKSNALPLQSSSSTTSRPDTRIVTRGLVIVTLLLGLLFNA